ncbi:MAG: MmcQ/YjbR family DNA-binding protein [Massiliimalia sp.]|jgi:predicted DNA-binding protein (MmcQ/YjbR family)
MRYIWLDDYLLNKRSVTKDFQPSWKWIRYHIGGKMFAAVCLDDSEKPYYINLKVDPMEGEFLRNQYEDIIPGYYCDKRNWVSVHPDGKVPDEVLKDLLDRAYTLMLYGFSKKRQREILGISCCGTECSECSFFQKECAGCNQSQGKVFHAPKGKACPIYACSVQKHRYATCQNCPELPCAVWRDTRDPQLTDEEFQASIDQRICRLKGEKDGI